MAGEGHLWRARGIQHVCTQSRPMVSAGGPCPLARGPAQGWMGGLTGLAAPMSESGSIPVFARDYVTASDVPSFPVARRSYRSISSRRYCLILGVVASACSLRARADAAQ